MIWILLLYVLPFFISCILGYRVSKESGETKGQYLLGVLAMLIPIFNIVFIMYVISEILEKSKTIKNIKEYLKQPL
jgi:heme/copper-type cytochrome/quinol oxidase subunit 2